MYVLLLLLICDVYAGAHGQLSWLKDTQVFCLGAKILSKWLRVCFPHLCKTHMAFFFHLYNSLSVFGLAVCSVSKLADVMRRTLVRVQCECSRRCVWPQSHPAWEVRHSGEVNVCACGCVYLLCMAVCIVSLHFCTQAIVQVAAFGHNHPMRQNEM